MNARLIAGAGGGGGKGGGEVHIAQEAPDTLRSKQYASIIDALCEGEIEGLVNGAKSIYVNETPLQNPDGSMNFKGVTFQSSTGAQQMAPKNAPGARLGKGGGPGYFNNGGVKSSTAIGVEIRHDTNTTRTINNPDADWAEVTIATPQLSAQDKSTGDINGTSVAFAIDLQNNGGGYVPQIISSRWLNQFSVGYSLTNSTGATSLRTVDSKVVGIRAWAWTVLTNTVTCRKVGTSDWIPMVRKEGPSIDGFFSLYYEALDLEEGQYDVQWTGDPVDCEVMIRCDYDEFSGKTMSRYQRTYKLALPGDGPWDIRVRRITPDAPDTSIQNKTIWDSMTECVDVKLAYPNTAAVMISLDAENFSSVPSRGYDIKGLRIKVPSNYDPINRTYTGIWDGTFKIAWSDSPPWCFYDLLTNKRYGLGDFIDANQIDKWQLYQIARYCDELVPDGYGGMEPRYTCNLYLQSREDAYKVISTMASIFRGMIYWAGGQIVPVQDAPSDPVALFTAANVIDGMFTYQGSDRRTRNTVALVSWNDPGDMCRQKIEYVQDDAAVLKYGVLSTEVLAAGCTSRGQAHRVGKRILLTQQNETEVITFKAGLDAARVTPGAIIATQDARRSGKRFGGRLASATTAVVTLDAPVTLNPGDTHEISVVMPDGKIETRPVTTAAGSGITELHVSPVFSVAPAPAAIWVINSSSLVTEKWRVIGIAEEKPTIVTITALQYDESKYADSEGGVTFDPIPTSTLRTRPEPVSDVVVRRQLHRVNETTFTAQLAVSWLAPSTAKEYEVTWRRNSEANAVSSTTEPYFEINNVKDGNYTITVVSKNALGLASSPVTFTYLVEPANEPTANAPDVTGVALSPNFLGRDLPITWNKLDAASYYEVEISDADSVVLRTDRASANSYTYTYAKNIADGGPRRTLKVRVRAKTLVGYSEHWTAATFSNPAPVAVSVNGDAGPGQAGVFVIRPADEDLAGMIVWMGASADFVPNDANEVYRGPDNAYNKLGLDTTDPVYFKVALYDAFGTTGLQVSPSVQVTPKPLGGITKVTTLPANPAAVGGQLAVFLDVADTALRGLYGWDGDEWINTSNIPDGSVTAVKMALAAVSAKNLAIKKHIIY